MKRRFLSLLLCCLLGLCCGCRTVPSEPDDRVQVISTIFASYDFARQLSQGCRIRVSLLLPPGTESHNYEPTAQDIISIQNSRLFLYAGGENDVWVNRLLSSLPDQVQTLKLLDCVTPYQEEQVEGMQAEEEEGDGGEWDEHVWTDPKNAAAICRRIAELLIASDPEEETRIRDNLASYLTQLEALDQSFRDLVSQARRRTLIFADRFPMRYFVEAYGLHYYAAFPGCSADTEPSATTVAFLVDKVRAEQIPVVLHMELSNEALCRTVCEATGAQGLLLHSCHNVSREEFDAGATYLSLMQENARVLALALN